MTAREYIDELQRTRQRLGLDTLEATAAGVTVHIDEERVQVSSPGQARLPVDLDALRYEAVA